MPSIPHFTQSSFAEMQRFLHLGVVESTYMITEKVDGINLSICNINKQLYLKTKKIATIYAIFLLLTLILFTNFYYAALTNFSINLRAGTCNAFKIMLAINFV